MKSLTLSRQIKDMDIQAEKLLLIEHTMQYGNMHDASDTDSPFQLL